MTRRTLTRRGATILASAILLAAAVLVSACGSGDKPAVKPSTLYPSPSASNAVTSGNPSPSPGTSTSPGTSSSPGTSTSPSPSSTGGRNGGGSSGTSTKKITDASIRGNILVRLSQEPTLRGIDFTVVVHNASVSLTGRVKTRKQKHSAEHIAVSEPGVKRVLSYIEVTGGGGY
jgi:hypothetical protein